MTLEGTIEFDTFLKSAKLKRQVERGIANWAEQHAPKALGGTVHYLIVFTRLSPYSHKSDAVTCHIELQGGGQSWVITLSSRSAREAFRACMRSLLRRKTLRKGVILVDSHADLNHYREMRGVLSLPPEDVAETVPFGLRLALGGARA